MMKVASNLRHQDYWVPLPVDGRDPDETCNYFLRHLANVAYL